MMNSFQQLPLVPFFKSLVEEGQQFFTAKNEFEKKQQELNKLIQDLAKSLDEIEYFDNIQNDLYNKEEKLLMKQSRDLLHNCEQLQKQLQFKISLINGYFFSKTNTYKEVVQSIEDLKAMIPLTSELETKSLEMLKTVLMPSYSSELNKIHCFDIQINLVLKVPHNIKEIFDQYPRHLKSSYQFKFQLSEDESIKNVYNFQRNQFIHLQKQMREVQIYKMSKNNHCSLELRNSLLYQPEQKITLLSDTEYVQSEILSYDKYQKFDKWSNKGDPVFQLFLTVNGANGVSVIRDQSTHLNLQKGQECELFENDQIVMLYSANFEPQISYLVQRIYMKKII